MIVLEGIVKWQGKTFGEVAIFDGDHLIGIHPVLIEPKGEEGDDTGCYSSPKGHTHTSFFGGFGLLVVLD